MVFEVNTAVVFLRVAEGVEDVVGPTRRVPGPRESFQGMCECCSLNLRRGRGRGWSRRRPTRAVVPRSAR